MANTVVTRYTRVQQTVAVNRDLESGTVIVNTRNAP